jgi:hypothetical protein
MKSNIVVCDNGLPEWGINIHKTLSECRQNGDTELAKTLEKKITASYLMSIRNAFETDSKVRQTLSKQCKAEELFEEIKNDLADLSKPGSEDIFEKSVMIILKELDTLRTKSHNAWVVSTTTGKLVCPLNEELVFQPPDFINEDGVLTKARPTVHPAITSALALAEQETNKKELLATLLDRPDTKLAAAHLLGPETILKRVTNKLSESGVDVCDAPFDGIITEIEFGREQLDGLSQSPNYKFHRIQMFTVTLFKKIVALCINTKKCHISVPKECKNSKQRWYTVKVTV